MGIGLSIFLLTVGAILKFAITAHVSGIDLQAIGVILMIAGAAMFVLSIAMYVRRPREPEPTHEYSEYEERPPER